MKVVTIKGSILRSNNFNVVRTCTHRLCVNEWCMNHCDRGNTWCVVDISPHRRLALLWRDATGSWSGRRLKHYSQVNKSLTDWKFWAVKSTSTIHVGLMTISVNVWIKRPYIWMHTGMYVHGQHVKKNERNLWQDSVTFHTHVFTNRCCKRSMISPYQTLSNGLEYNPLRVVPPLHTASCTLIDDWISGSKL